MRHTGCISLLRRFFPGLVAVALLAGPVRAEVLTTLGYPIEAGPVDGYCRLDPAQPAEQALLQVIAARAAVPMRVLLGYAACGELLALRDGRADSATDLGGVGLVLTDGTERAAEDSAAFLAGLAAGRDEADTAGVIARAGSGEAALLVRASRLIVMGAAPEAADGTRDIRLTGVTTIFTVPLAITMTAPAAPEDAARMLDRKRTALLFAIDTLYANNDLQNDQVPSLAPSTADQFLTLGGPLVLGLLALIGGRMLWPLFQIGRRR